MSLHAVGSKKERCMIFADAEVRGIIDMIFDNCANTELPNVHAMRVCSITEVIQTVLLPFRRAFFVYYMGDVHCKMCIICKLVEYIKTLTNILIDTQDPYILWAECALAVWERKQESRLLRLLV